MKDLRLFLEHRTINEIKIKCEQTGKEIEPEYTIYDKFSLDEFIKKYKANKDQFNKYSFNFAYLKGNNWIVKSDNSYILDITRINDKFLSSDSKEYSYDDIIKMLEDGNIILIITK